jgi:NTP pyrophosphatase (non-canonical NTP hydrolase)
VRWPKHFDAWRKGREDVGEELADVAIYLLGLAEMTGIDLQDEIEAKLAKNAARVYHRLPNGALAKSKSQTDLSIGGRRLHR